MAHSRKRSSKKNSRSLRLESLERRNLLAGDVFHNYLSPSDVNNDNQVSALDALTVINRLNRLETVDASGEGEQIESSAFADVNDDGRTTAIDALMIINQLNLDSGSIDSSGQELKARLSGISGERAKVEVENKGGGLKLEVKIHNALPGESYDVTVGNSIVATLVTNARGLASLETFLTGAAADAAANAGTSVGISGIGAGVFGGEQSDDDSHGEHNDNDSHDNDEDRGDGHDDDIDDGPWSETDSNDSDSDDSLNNSGESDSSYDIVDSSDDVGVGTSSFDSIESDTESNDSDSIDDVDHDLDNSSDSDSDNGPSHVNDDASEDSDSDNDGGSLTPSVPGTTYGVSSDNDNGFGDSTDDNNQSHDDDLFDDDSRIGDDFDDSQDHDSSHDSDDLGSGNDDNNLSDDSGSDVGSSSDDVLVIAGSTTQAYGKWKTYLNGNGTAEIEFEKERGETEFEVEVRGLAPNASFAVTIGGVPVGQVHTDSRGRGKLKYKISDDHYHVFPADFPVIEAGVTIQIGTHLSGAFGSARSGHHDD